jgi:hypothetical protein
MNRFDKIPPEHIYTMMLCVVGAWMIGRSLVLPFISPFAGDVMGACGLAMTLCAIVIGEITRDHP